VAEELKKVQSAQMLEPRAAPALSSELGVIDIGSNTARLVVFASTPEGGLRAILESKEVPRLGMGRGRDGSLSREAIERGIGALRRFSRMLAASRNPRTVSVATSAVRDAPNGAEFLQRVRRETHLTPQILSGEEEGRFAYLGVSSAFSLASDLVVDLGGGSLQGARVYQGRLAHTVSRPLGALRLTEEFLRHDPPKPKELDELRDHVRRDLRKFPSRGNGRLFGVGGSIRSLGRVAIQLRNYPIPRVHGYPISRRDLEALGGLLFEMPSERRKGVAGLSGQRADVILAAIVIVDELLRASEADQMYVCGTGIREGIANETLQIPLPAPAEELAHRSVSAYARALGFSMAHGEDVANAATSVFDQLHPIRGRDAGARLALKVGGWMHDSGTVIDPGLHAEHSAYILRNGTIFGLFHRETLLASMAAQLHEGDEAPPGWRREFRGILEDKEIELAEELGALLFLAETLIGSGVSARVSRGGKKIVLSASRSVRDRLSDRSFDRLVRAFDRALDLEVTWNGR
jgi:exopolyphosphatase / guanosine-5'-triphosphate,3'-diphosphate pyrophosphatase